MSTTSAVTPMVHPPKSWYREPYVWLVVGGPLVVVVASLVTVYIAVKFPDPVIKSSVPTQSINAGTAGPADDDERKAIERSNLPAGLARNHAASPSLPKDR